MATARGAKVDAPTSASRPDPLGSIDAEGRFAAMRYWNWQGRPDGILYRIC